MVDMLKNLGKIGSALFAVQLQLKVKFIFLLECPAYTREKEEFFYKINKLWNRTSLATLLQ